MTLLLPAVSRTGIERRVLDPFIDGRNSLGAGPETIYRSIGA
jgi:hypothetical protein